MILNVQKNTEIHSKERCHLCLYAMTACCHFSDRSCHFLWQNDKRPVFSRERLFSRLWYLSRSTGKCVWFRLFLSFFVISNGQKWQNKIQVTRVLSHICHFVIFLMTTKNIGRSCILYLFVIFYTSTLRRKKKRERVYI